MIDKNIYLQTAVKKFHGWAMDCRLFGGSPPSPPTIDRSPPNSTVGGSSTSPPPESEKSEGKIYEHNYFPFPTVIFYLNICRLLKM